MKNIKRIVSYLIILWAFLLCSCEPISYKDYRMEPYTGAFSWELVSRKAEWSNRYDHAAVSFDGKLWKLAFMNGELAGLILPQTYPDAAEEGSIFNIGLVPDCRGRGLGKVLHANGLEVLARVGAVRYVGSCDIHNAPMLRVFAANECVQEGVRVIYRRDSDNTPAHQAVPWSEPSPRYSQTASDETSVFESVEPAKFRSKLMSPLPPSLW